MSLFDELFGPTRFTEAMAAANAAQQIASLQAAQNMSRGRILAPGIFWERTSGKTHRVVIRRAPEIAPDWSWLGYIE